MGEVEEQSDKAGRLIVVRTFATTRLKSLWNYRVALVVAFIIVASVSWYGWHHFNSYQAQHLDELAKDDYALYNLSAQQDIAEWTYSMFWVGVLGLLASIVGIGFVYGNLREMRAQTLATREVGEKQTRAYVFASSASIEVPDPSLSRLARPPPFIYVEVENTGSTPATLLEGKATLKIETGTAKDRAISAEMEQDSTIDALVSGYPQRMRFILPSEHFDVAKKPYAGNALAGSSLNPSPSDYAKLAAQAGNPLMPNYNALAGVLKRPSKIKKVTCRGEISYNDVFGDQFSSEFHFVFLGYPLVLLRVLFSRFISTTTTKLRAEQTLAPSSSNDLALVSQPRVSAHGPGASLSW